jgi:hypothetical protein
MLSQDDGERYERRARSKTVQGMLNRSDSRKALGYFLAEFWPSRRKRETTSRDFENSERL